MLWGHFFRNARLKPGEIRAIETEINKPSEYVFDGRLSFLLNLEEKKELACIIYSLCKLYTQAIESENSIDETKKAEEKGAVNQEFIVLLEYILNLQRIKSKAFDCNVPKNNQLIETENMIDSYIGERSILSLITKRASLAAEQSRNQFYYRITIPTLVFLYAIDAFILKTTPRNTIFFMLAQLNAISMFVIGIMLDVMAKKLYPGTDPIFGFNSLMNGAAYRYVTNSRCTQENKLLISSADYMKFFAENPDIKPQTLYELVHKFFVGFDFYGTKSWKDLKEALQDFLQEARLNGSWDAEEQVEFPVEEFLKMEIISKATPPLRNWIEWEDESSTTKEETPQKKITDLLVSQGFCQRASEGATTTLQNHQNTSVMQQQL